MAKSELEKLIKERDKLVSTRDSLKYEKSKKNRDVKIAELNERIERLSPKKVSDDKNTHFVDFTYKDFLDVKTVKIDVNLFKHIENFFNSSLTFEEFISESDSSHECYCCVDYKSYPQQKDIYSTQIIHNYLFDNGFIDNTITVNVLEEILFSISDRNSSNSLLMFIPMVNIRVPKRLELMQNRRFFRMWMLRSKYDLHNKEYVNDYYYSTELIIKSEIKRLNIKEDLNSHTRLLILKDAPYKKVNLKQRVKDKINSED